MSYTAEYIQWDRENNGPIPEHRNEKSSRSAEASVNWLRKQTGKIGAGRWSFEFGAEDKFKHDILEVHHSVDSDNSDEIQQVLEQACEEFSLRMTAYERRQSTSEQLRDQMITNLNEHVGVKMGSRTSTVSLPREKVSRPNTVKDIGLHPGESFLMTYGLRLKLSALIGKKIVDLDVNNSEIQPVYEESMDEEERRLILAGSQLSFAHRISRALLTDVSDAQVRTLFAHTIEQMLEEEEAKKGFAYLDQDHVTQTIALLKAAKEKVESATAMGEPRVQKSDTGLRLVLPYAQGL